MKNIHVLPTDKPSRVRIGNNGNFVVGLAQSATASKNDSYTNQNIYITSDEEIKEGDWFVTTCTNEIHKSDWIKFNFDNGKKIILTTDQDLNKDGVQAINDEFLEWWINNPSCEWVEVKFELLWLNKRFGGIWQPFPDEQATERKRSYKIIIPKEELSKDEIDRFFIDMVCNSKEEAKQETLEEAALKKYRKNPFWIGSGDSSRLYDEFKSQRDAFIAGAKWQAERSYTLEQIQEEFIGVDENGQPKEGYFDLYLNFRLGMDMYPPKGSNKNDYIDWKNNVKDRKKVSFIEWFEQFKNK